MKLIQFISQKKSLLLMIVGGIAIVIFLYVIVQHVNRSPASNLKEVAVTIDENDILVQDLNYYVVSTLSSSILPANNPDNNYVWPYGISIPYFILNTSTECAIKDYVFCQEAMKKGLKLTKEDITSYQEKMQEFYDQTTKEKKETYSISLDLLEPIYERKALADKYFDQFVATKEFKPIYDEILKNYSITLHNDVINTVIIPEDLQ